MGIETEVHPWTALDTEQQFVRVSLEVQLPCGYPDIRPTVRLFNPRGLDDSTFCRIREDISKKCTQNLGQPVIFEIIEVSNVICSYK